MTESDGYPHDKFTVALLEASMNGQASLVQLLLNAGANVDGTNASGFTALYAASQHGHLPTVNILLDAGADVNHATDYGFTSLHIASIHGHVEVIRRLLSVPGINKYAAENTDRCTALQAAAQEGHPAVVRCFMESIGTGDEEREACGRSLLIAVKRHHKEIIDVLLNAGVATDFADIDGFTPLQAAAGGGHLELVELFLGKGADVNHANNAGYTPLHAASLGGHVDVVKRLLAAGADATRRSREGYLAIDAAAQSGSEAVLQSLLDAMRK
jgi:ankyrin repeat protein